MIDKSYLEKMKLANQHRINRHAKKLLLKLNQTPGPSDQVMYALQLLDCAIAAGEIRPTEVQESAILFLNHPRSDPKKVLKYLNNLSGLSLSDDPLETALLILEEIDDRMIEQGYR